MSCVSAFLCLRKDKKKNSCLSVIRNIVVLTSLDIFKNLMKADFDEKILLIFHVLRSRCQPFNHVSVEHLINS